MAYQANTLGFNSAPSRVMHIDLNSAFATIEQQANPFLREKHIAVSAYDSPGGCILAPSIEAKRYGVKTGMRVRDGKKLCPHLRIITPDPDKYRMVHLALREILKMYTNDFHSLSIDEFVLNLEGYPRGTDMVDTAYEIKGKIKKEIGEWMSVSVGISTNRFLAKTASGLHKPDGLDEINKDNYREVYSNLGLKDLNGIDARNELRLNRFGIYSVLNFSEANLTTLKSVFSGICGYYWYLRLRGWEIDNFAFARKSFGNSYALPSSRGNIEELLPILARLTEKTGARLRQAGYKAGGVHVSLFFRNKNLWHHGEKTQRQMFDSKDIYKEAVRILKKAPTLSPVHTLAVSVFNLKKDGVLQLELLEDVVKKEELVKSFDKVNKRWGKFVMTYGNRLKLKNTIHDRIAFGGVREL